MNIFESLNKVMEDIGAIGKNSKNSTQGFMYRGVDAVMNALQPALIKHRVFVVPEVIEQVREERVNSKGTTLIYSIAKIKYTFYAEDGTSVSAVVIGEGMDTGDKSMNKAMSVAFKCACFQVLCIPTEEMVDPDAECHEVAKKGAGTEVPPVPTYTTITPEQKAKMLAEINRAKFSMEGVLEWLGKNGCKVKTLDDIPQNMFEKYYKAMLSWETR